MKGFLDGCTIELLGRPLDTTFLLGLSVPAEKPKKTRDPSKLADLTTVLCFEAPDTSKALPVTCFAELQFACCNNMRFCQAWIGGRFTGEGVRNRVGRWSDGLATRQGRTTQKAYQSAP